MMQSSDVRHYASSGLYEVVSTQTGARYFGTAYRMGVRRQRHFRDLRAGEHVNPHLQAAWNLYGEDAFQFRVRAVLEKDQLRETEQRLLDRMYGREDCYNVSRDASAPMAGRRHSAETIELMRSKITGLKRSAESRARYAAASRKRGFSELARLRSIEAKLGKKQSPEHVGKRADTRRGRKQSQETVERRVAKLKGRKERPEVVAAKRLRTLSREHREKIAATRRGSRASDETRAKMVAAHVGQNHSDATRGKCAAMKSAWWAAKKANEQGAA